MRDKITFGEIYEKLKELRHQRDLYSRIIAETLVEGDKDSTTDFVEKYEHVDDIIDYYSSIEVEFENKYATEDE